MVVKYSNIVCLMLTDAGWIIFQDLCLGRSTILATIQLDASSPSAQVHLPQVEIQYSIQYFTSCSIATLLPSTGDTLILYISQRHAEDLARR